MDIVNCPNCGKSVLQIEMYVRDPSSAAQFQLLDPMPAENIVVVRASVPDVLATVPSSDPERGRIVSTWVRHEQTCIGVAEAEVEQPQGGLINSGSLAGAFS